VRQASFSILRQASFICIVRNDETGLFRFSSVEMLEVTIVNDVASTSCIDTGHLFVGRDEQVFVINEHID